ncbi:MAG TPA: hypothetical protein DCL68_04000 [Gammaproteobacteria bacterium]|nr:hypothetical protein [Gammaproteobacteria bacterium]|tara:strand:+ start:72 stop:674 length:603 start_codon:yes stop_codon:yes gene_type:complete
MTFEELRVVVVVYTTAIVPIIILLNLHLRDRLPRSILKIYLSTFLICALGWELWFTYGLYAGDPVDLRRSEVLNQLIPKNINWLMNSLADAGTISLGGILLTGKLMGSDRTVFNQWNIGAFLILLIWCISQNILVEMFLYYDQLAVGKDLSWAPLAPTGPWMNPVLFQYGDRTITLHGQVPWLLMTPILYFITMHFGRKE